MFSREKTYSPIAYKLWYDTNSDDFIVKLPNRVQNICFAVDNVTVTQFLLKGFTRKLRDARFDNARFNHMCDIRQRTVYTAKPLAQVWWLSS